MEACISTPFLGVTVVEPGTATVDPNLQPQPRAGSLLAELRGVPKPALEVIFGKPLGRRIWQQLRTVSGARAGDPAGPERRVASANDSAAAVITDADVVAGMAGHVCRRAGAALRERGRQAKSLALTIHFADGISICRRTELASPSNDHVELTAAALGILREAAGTGAPVQSLDLSVTSIECVQVKAPAQAARYRLAAATAAHA